MSIDRSENMRRIRGKDTAPEMVVRRLVYSLGYRYRLHRYDLPGRPDLVFVDRRKVILIHGCFWHQHGCKVSHIPKSNSSYWKPKLERNHARDARNLRALRKAGWRVLVIWECRLKDSQKLSQIVNAFLS